jgi:hypothetical protein
LQIHQLLEEVAGFAQRPIEYFGPTAFANAGILEIIKNSEKIKGVIDLNFSINASGRVGKMDIKAKDARFSRNGIDCMGQVLGIIEFPKPKGGGIVDVRQPLNFFAETEKI